MKLWRKFKLLLLVWLLDDICASGDCMECKMNHQMCLECFNCPITSCCDCGTHEVEDQARRVWKLEDWRMGKL